ncbi:MAG: two-component regulator propeller domain-containing protein [Bacteroidota bacterium]
MRIRLYSLIIFWFCCTVVRAQQELNIIQMDRTDGLSQNSVFAITQDRDGFLWFGTRNGLNKYDGVHFTVYRHGMERADQLISNDIRELYFHTSSGLIWIGTTEGLSSYDPIKEQFQQYLFPESSTPTTPFISSICSDQSNRLWIGSNAGLHYIENSQLHTLPLPAMAGSVTALTEDSYQRLWIGTNKGLFILDKSRTNVSPFSLLNFHNLYVRDIHKDKTGAIWIGTQKNGVFRYVSSDKITHWTRGDGKDNTLTHNTIREIIEDQQGNIYIGTLLGLNRFHLKEQQLIPIQLNNEYEAQKALSSNSIHSLYADNQNGLWIGTYYGGVSYHNPSLMQFQTYRHLLAKNSINFNVVSSFLKDAANNYWIGTEGGGLNYWNTTTDQYESYQYDPTNNRSLSGNNVKTILQDNDGLWIGTYQNGLNFAKHPRQGFEIYQHDSKDATTISNNNVYDLLKSNDSTLWIATFGGGLNRMNTNTTATDRYFADETIATSISSNLCRTLFQDQDHTIWVGTDAGLNQVNSEQGDVTFKTYLTDLSIYSIQQSADQFLWLGTATNGLIRFDLATKTYEPVLTTQEWVGTAVYGILVEDDTHLWLSTNRGLFKYNITDGTLYAFGNADGLENLEYNFNAYYQTEDGQFFFGSTNGFTTFRPEEIRLDTTIYPLIFTDIRVSGDRMYAGTTEEGLLRQHINHTEALTFDYGTANFTLEFAVLNYTGRKQHHYAYRMKGIDQEWIEAGEDLEATYTIQRPGSYTFQVKSTDSQGIWSDNFRTINITVRPPWWNSNWAYVLYFSFVGLVFWSLMRYYQLRESYRLAELSKRQQTAINDMKQRFFTNITHEFRTPLTLIISPLEDLLCANNDQSRPQLQLIHKNANRLLALVNQLLTFRTMESDHLKLRVREMDLIALLKEVYLSFEDKAARHDIDYQFNVQEEHHLLWFDQEKIEKVFYNLLSNAFKFTPNGGRIAIELAHQQEHIAIHIVDSGRGIAAKNIPFIFDRFYESNNEQSGIGSGIGLSMSKELVELHHGSIKVNSQLQKGTTFTVTLPTSNLHFTATDFAPTITYEHPKEIAAGTLAEMDVTLVHTAATKNTLLIVEDNLDIARYVRSMFEQQYEVVVAENGKMGYKKAHELSPDIIISDIMMPEMNGIDLCQLLKSELATSHIPIILLTARTTSIHELEGMKIGADDYISKPFNAELLRLKVANIIQTRKRLYEKIIVEQSLRPKEIAINSADQQFLEQLLDIIETHMEDANFDIASFSQELTISRSTLYKKIKSLTNQTPKSLLKEMRLKRAAQLLESEELKVSEVAYRVGFNDPKYFARCFQQKYNCTPTDYLASLN